MGRLKYVLIYSILSFNLISSSTVLQARLLDLRVIWVLFRAASHNYSLFPYRNWIYRGDRYKYAGRTRATRNNALDYSRRRNAACDAASLRSSFFLTLAAAAAVYHRASDGASLPSPFVHAFSVRFPRINKIPLWRHMPEQRYNKPGNRPLTKCLKIIDNRAHNNEYYAAM